jgi:hypothetical protein
MALFTFLMLGATEPKQIPSMTEIQAACERQFGIETEAAASCQLRTVLALADADNRRRQDRVLSELGL